MRKNALMSTQKRSSTCTNRTNKSNTGCMMTKSHIRDHFTTTFPKTFLKTTHQSEFTQSILNSSKQSIHNNKRMMTNHKSNMCSIWQKTSSDSFMYSLFFFRSFIWWTASTSDLQLVLVCFCALGFLLIFIGSSFHYIFMLGSFWTRNRHFYIPEVDFVAFLVELEIMMVSSHFVAMLNLLVFSENSFIDLNVSLKNNCFLIGISKNFIFTAGKKVLFRVIS